MDWNIIKTNTTVIGIDDSGFKFIDDHWKKVPVFGVVTRGSEHIEGIVETEILRDDPDPTTKIIDMIRRSKQIKNIRAIFHSGLTIGGFGVIDINRIPQELDIPVIIIVNRYPDYEGIYNALQKHFKDYQTRWDILIKSQKPIEIEKQRFIQYTGISQENAVELINICSKIGKQPEALRIAHLMGVSRYQYYNGIKKE